jgi:hypothetical protein
MDTERSFERLTEDDLAHLSEVAQDVVKDDTWIALLCWLCAKERRSITWTAETA